MADNNTMFALKLTVFSLGVMLIGGIALAGTVLYKRMNAPKEVCKPQDLTLPITANYNVLRSDEHSVTLLVTGKKGHQIAKIDLCSGDILASLNILPRELPKQEEADETAENTPDGEKAAKK